MKVSLFIALMPLFVFISCTPVAGNVQPQTGQSNGKTVVAQASVMPGHTPTSPIEEPTGVPGTTTPQPVVTPVETATALPTFTQTPTAADATSNPLDNPELAEDGLRVYKEQYCGLCHQLDAAGTTGLFGPSHNQVAVNAAQHVAAANYSGSATDPAGYIRESILAPELYMVDGYAFSRHKMPAYTHLSQADVDALVQFLLQQQ